MWDFSFDCLDSWEIWIKIEAAPPFSPADPLAEPWETGLTNALEIAEFWDVWLPPGASAPSGMVCGHLLPLALPPPLALLALAPPQGKHAREIFLHM